MNKIRFVNEEHKSFYTQMLAKTKNDDSYHHAFSTQWGFAKKLGEISAPFLISTKDVLRRRDFMQDGKPGQHTNYAALHLIYGMVRWRKATSKAQNLMNCSIASFTHIFLRR